MAGQSKHVQVGKRRLEITNLGKVLYPDDSILKAEIIQYYHSIAPTMLAHIKGRALSLVRFPEGIDHTPFFQKNKPDWAPEWIDYVSLGSEQKKDYMIASEQATLAWLANMACLELHQMHARAPMHEYPDYIVYDLDPPEIFDFNDLKMIALGLKEHLEHYDYTCFIKTTGGKGLHVITPIQAKYTFSQCFETAKVLAQEYVKKESTTTLQIKKEARKGRVLVDIYRNRTSQTIVCPYSLRGFAGAPVSMPIRWEELQALESAQAHNIHTAIPYVMEYGDAWQGIGAYAAEIHTERKTSTTGVALKGNKHKTPQQLEEYTRKRDFAKTPEPKALYSGGDNTGFVVHRHHASHLHYDLRLEENGVLRSWALPRGLPTHPGVKRLAMQTEDHPLEYMTFEGEIPKGQYGGGKMWIYANGRYSITKQKKDGFYFTLNSPQINAEYRMHLMKDKEWLLERVDVPQFDYLQDPLKPMLAESADSVPLGEEYLYELKWDGIRAIIIYNEGEVSVWSRGHKKLNVQFPELLLGKESFKATNAVFDGEIVCFDAQGRPDFKAVIHRMQKSRKGDIERSMKKNVAFCYLFDLIYLDGRLLTGEPLLRRRVWLEDLVKHGTNYRVSEALKDGQELFDAASSLGLEGIMAKDTSSKYYPGKRSNGWIKVKTKKSAEALIIGYTEGKGDRESEFGALHLAQRDEHILIYRGKVGTGFTQDTLTELHGILQNLKEIDRPIAEKPPDDSRTVWVEPVLYCEINYTVMTGNGYFRDPVFLRLRQDMK